MGEKKGIKEIKELLAAVKVLKEIGDKAMLDGEFDWKDSALLIDLGAAMPVFMAAVKDSKLAIEEGKDIDEAEMKEIISLLYAL